MQTRDWHYFDKICLSDELANDNLVRTLCGPCATRWKNPGRFVWEGAPPTPSPWFPPFLPTPIPSAICRLPRPSHFQWNTMKWASDSSKMTSMFLTQTTQPHTFFPNLVPPTLCTPTLCTLTLCWATGPRTRWHKVLADLLTAIYICISIRKSSFVLISLAY